MKQRALAETNDLDDFETVADLVSALPLSFSESELDTLREAYSEFADKYAGECDLNNPDDLREQASRVGNVGELLHVDTDAVQEMLRESADEIEKDEEPRWRRTTTGGAVMAILICVRTENSTICSALWGASILLNSRMCTMQDAQKGCSARPQRAKRRGVRFGTLIL